MEKKEKRERKLSGREREGGGEGGREGGGGGEREGGEGGRRERNLCYCYRCRLQTNGSIQLWTDTQTSPEGCPTILLT